MTLVVCSDTHYTDDPRTDDMTPGIWALLGAHYADEVWLLGDVVDRAQCAYWPDAVASLPIGLGLIGGNHDQGCLPAFGQAVRRDGVFLCHGHRATMPDGTVVHFDPFLSRLLDRPVQWLVGWLERHVSRDADVWLERHMLRVLGRWLGGRLNTDPQGHALELARVARAWGCHTAAMGHRHELWEVEVEVATDKDCLTVERVRVFCTGCCCGGRMDFVEIET